MNQNLTGAASLTEIASQSQSSTTNEVALNIDYENAVPIALQIYIGIFKLEGTGLEITADQAGI